MECVGLEEFRRNFMTTLLYKTTGKKFTVFSDTCIDVMDFFLSHSNLYFTPTTAALSMKKSVPTVKACMNLLKSNYYLSKISNDGSTYHITKENMEFYNIDFRNYVLNLEKIKDGKSQFKEILIHNNEDDE